MAVTANTRPRNSRIEKRIRSVPEDRRTHARDEAARMILAWKEDPDVEWPLSGPEMEERSGDEYSAQHFRHTTSLYRLNEDNPFEDSESVNTERTHGVNITTPVDVQFPDDVDVESYARGWIAGYLRASEER